MHHPRVSRPLDQLTQTVLVLLLRSSGETDDKVQPDTRCELQALTGTSPNSTVRRNLDSILRDECPTVEYHGKDRGTVYGCAPTKTIKQTRAKAVLPRPSILHKGCTEHKKSA
jgi:hypothetical protein